MASGGGWRGGAPFAGLRVKALGRHHIGNVHGSFALDNRALRIILIFAGMLFDHFDPFNYDPVLLPQDLNDLAALAAFGAGDDHHFIPFFYMKFLHKLNYFWRQGDDLHELFLAKLAGDRPENPCPARIVVLIDYNYGI